MWRKYKSSQIRELDRGRREALEAREHRTPEQIRAAYEKLKVCHQGDSSPLCRFRKDRGTERRCGATMMMVDCPYLGGHAPLVEKVEAAKVEKEKAKLCLVPPPTT